MRRRLSPYEHAVWAAGEVLPVTIAATARVHGRTTPGRLRWALAALRERHPLLAVRVLPGRLRGRLTDEGVGDLPLRVVRSTAADTWERVVREELQEPFDTWTGPLARFVLVDAGDTFDLICVYHHLVADAFSGAVVVRDLLSWLSGASPRGPVATAPPADALLPPGRARPADLVALSRALGGPACPTHEPGPLTYHTWTLGADRTTALLARCRAERVTLHSALCAAFARALPHPARVAVAADLRRILEPVPEEAVGLYAASFLMDVDGTACRPFWSLARDVRADLQRRLRPHRLVPLVRGLRLVPLPGRALGELLHRSESRGSRFDVGVSNARLPIPADYGPLRLSAMYGAAHTSLGGAPLVIVLGVRGALCFGVTSTDPGAAALCERAMSHLTDALVLPVRLAGRT
ncbi:condensation domain-containing protein [Streptomyces gamaensis]|uniref:Condensation domain-containing protein n=1 Tax=Streptomyces gamaensis TaxID=1763542 RepID=A0ABW0Z600_9ACTN